MRLTQRQEWMIARHLRDVGVALDDVSDSAREQALTRLRGRIHRRLDEISSVAGQLRDEDVETVLNNTVKAAQQSEGTGGTLERLGGMTLASGERRWLGVCGGLSEYFGIDVRWVRAAFLALGVTGPVSLIIYLGFYAEMYMHSDSEEIPRISAARVILHSFGVAAAVIGLHVGTRLLLWGIEEAHSRLAGAGPLPALGNWDWLRANTSFFLFCALVSLVSVAVLRSLPIPDDWRETLKRVIQAGIVLYAFVLSLGVAAFLAGVILHAVKALSA